MAARDPFGVKPLYWWTDGRRMALASEIGALLASGLVEPKVDRMALDHFLACRFVPAPRTLFEGVRKLPAASIWWREGAPPRVDELPRGARRPVSTLGDEELAHELAERFTDAVERQMMSDVPYGAFLSGGVDSAAMVAAMASDARSRRPRSRSASPARRAVLDEREYAAETARLIGTDHHATAMAQDDFLASSPAACRGSRSRSGSRRRRRCSSSRASPRRT